MRDLGAVLDHEKLLPMRHAIHCAGQDRTRHGRARMIL